MLKNFKIKLPQIFCRRRLVFDKRRKACAQVVQLVVDQFSEPGPQVLGGALIITLYNKIIFNKKNNYIFFIFYKSIFHFFIVHWTCKREKKISNILMKFFANLLFLREKSIFNKIIHFFFNFSNKIL
jgi:hypothetical protein